MSSFLDSLTTLPKPFRAEEAAMARDRLTEEITGRQAGAEAWQAVLAHRNGTALLDAVLGNSPFLSGIIHREPQTFLAFCQHGPDAAFEALADEITATNATHQGELEIFLRVMRQRMALLIALADITNAWPMERVTRHLSIFAELAVGKTVDFLLTRAANQGHVQLADAARPSYRSGLIILGMGKLGGYELNYSSDIDLILFYDRERIQAPEGTNLQKVFVKLAQDMVNILQQRTAEGYVFRTDLRLRPDPASTPLALSVAGAITYYETVGQNWERAALIKARPIAGDIEAGEEFLKIIAPFIWRRNLDFAAIQDIQSIKRQIDARNQTAPDHLAGYNVKLGKGGIREIEFYAQTQQLIWGGKQPTLRSRSTCEALAELTRLQHIPVKDAIDLTTAYYFMREVEHRLQMVDDQQTHSLPETLEGIAHIATFLGYPTPEAFEEKLRATAELIGGLYAALYADTPSLAGPGMLVFTGVENDAGTVRTIGDMGYKDADAVCSAIRSWHHGGRRATRTKRARELITELTPTLLAAFARQPDADLSFRRFDEFLARLPASAQLFSLFASTPKLVDLIAEILGESPFLAELLSRTPRLLDSLLYPHFFKSLRTQEELKKELSSQLKVHSTMEEQLEIIRRTMHEHQFQAGVLLLKRLATPEAAAEMLSALAEVIIQAVLDVVLHEFRQEYGEFTHAEMGVIAFGRLGSRAMNLNSDLDLVLVYHATDEEERSSGAKSFQPNVYFIRLTQRFISALSTVSAEGRLYEIDTRLRPHGADGPLAASLGAFKHYYEHAAWPIEYLSLTRARPVSGSPALREQLQAAIDSALHQPRAQEDLANHVRGIRGKIAEQHKITSPWDIKYAPGGTMDIELLAQFLTVKHLPTHPHIATPHPLEAFRNLSEAGLISEAQGKYWQETWQRYQQVQTYQWLLGGIGHSQSFATERTFGLLASETGEPTMEALTAQLQERQDSIMASFAEIIGDYRQTR